MDDEDSDKLTYHVNKLGKSQAHFHGETVRVVAHGPDESVVVREEIVVEPLCVRVGDARRRSESSQRHP